jgi:hypothetical protein
MTNFVDVSGNVNKIIQPYEGPGGYWDADNPPSTADEYNLIFNYAGTFEANWWIMYGYLHLECYFTTPNDGVTRKYNFSNNVYISEAVIDDYAYYAGLFIQNLDTVTTIYNHTGDEVFYDAPQTFTDGLVMQEIPPNTRVFVSVSVALWNSGSVDEHIDFTGNITIICNHRANAICAILEGN